MTNFHDRMRLIAQKTSPKNGTMSEIILNPDLLKETLKSAIVELLHEHRTEVTELLTDIIENMAMELAIDEGKTTEIVSREAIFQLLEPKV